MRKLVGLLTVTALAATLHAGLDISFSSSNGGFWSYTADGAGHGTFSFNQPVGIDTVQGTDALPGNMFVTIPDLYVSNLTEQTIGGSYGLPQMKIYIGSINPEPMAITVTNGKGTGSGSNILTGSLDPGIIVIVGTTASLYPNFVQDITSIEWESWTDGPESMDFALTLQGGDIAAMILDANYNGATSGSFSGNLTAIPEPATLLILALGSVLMCRNKLASLQTRLMR